MGKDKNTFIKYFFVFLILTLIGVRDIVDLSIPNNLIVGIAILPLILLPYHQAISFLFFILPFTCGIPGYTVLLSYIIILAKARQYNIWQFLPPIIIGVLELIHITFSNINIDNVIFISFLSFISLFFFLLFESNERINNAACVRMFTYGTIAVLVIVFIGIITNNSFTDLIAGTLREGSRMGIEESVEKEISGHLALNANSIAYYSITAFSLLLLGNKRLVIPFSLYVVLICLSILTGVFTFSRTWIFLFAFVLLIYLLVTKRKLLSFSLIGIVVLGALFLYAPIIDMISEAFLGRFENVETAGGRTEIFAAYNEFWLSKFSYILTGAGAMCYRQIIDIDKSMHNGIQQIYVSYGLVGILLFYAVIRQYSLKYIPQKQPIMYYLPFIACFIFDQSIQFWDPYYLIFPFLATAYVLRIRETEK